MLDAGRFGKSRLTLLHTADLHLGNDVYPNDALGGFDQVLETARDRGADGVLIAGDLFDSSQAPLDTVAYVFQELKELELPVFILPGNHDTLLTGTYGASDRLLRLPSNVHLFSEAAGELLNSPGLHLSVWGRPVYDHNFSFHPLQGVLPRPSDGWYVVMGHGLVIDGRSGSSRSSPITTQELQQTDCDYIALGHVHVFREVTQDGPPAFYCGAPSGIQRKTVALVTLDPITGVAVTHISLA